MRSWSPPREAELRARSTPSTTSQVSRHARRHYGAVQLCTTKCGASPVLPDVLGPAPGLTRTSTAQCVKKVPFLASKSAGCRPAEDRGVGPTTYVHCTMVSRACALVALLLTAMPSPGRERAKLGHTQVQVVEVTGWLSRDRPNWTRYDLAALSGGATFRTVRWRTGSRRRAAYHGRSTHDLQCGRAGREFLELFGGQLAEELRDAHEHLMRQFGRICHRTNLHS